MPISFMAGAPSMNGLMEMEAIMAPRVDAVTQAYGHGAFGALVGAGFEFTGVNRFMEGYYGVSLEGNLLSTGQSTLSLAMGGLQIAAFGATARVGDFAGEASGLRTWQGAGMSAENALRIQNAATRTNQQIIVVGSRARGTPNPMSDWDYIFTGPSRARNSAAGSVPRGAAGGEVNASGIESGIDRFQSYNPKAPNYRVVDPSEPHVTFDPRSKRQ
jgi:hypothetical protein